MSCGARIYHPSAVEQQWFNGASGRICELALSQSAAVAPWLKFVQHASWAAAPEGREKHVLSHWQLPGGSIEYIEPLTGIARQLVKIPRH